MGEVYRRHRDADTGELHLIVRMDGAQAPQEKREPEDEDPQTAQERYAEEAFAAAVKEARLLAASGAFDEEGEEGGVLVPEGRYREMEDALRLARAASGEEAAALQSALDQAQAALARAIELQGQAQVEAQELQAERWHLQRRVCSAERQAGREAARRASAEAALEQSQEAARMEAARAASAEAALASLEHDQAKAQCARAAWQGELDVEDVLGSSWELLGPA